MTKKDGDLFDILAAAGYENFFEGDYNELPENSIERAMWKQIAKAIIDKYKEIGGK